MEKIQSGTEASAPATSGDIVGAVTDQTAREKLESGDISQEEYDALETFTRSVNGARMYLWQNALKEIKSAPFTGQGSFFFWVKYGAYPHNFFFELATDFGLILTLAVLLLGLFVFFRLTRLALREPVYMAFLLYVLAFPPQNMVSGSAYSSGVFFQYGFCVLLAFLPEKTFSERSAEMI